MIGAAAVVSIYAVGLERTREAADRLAAEDAAHRRAAPVERIPLPSADTLRAISAVAAAARETVVVAAGPTAAPRAVLPTVAAAKVPTATSASDTAVQDPSPKDTALVVVPSPAPAPATDTVAAIAPAAPRWRDGNFSGWGNSRHGSIEATVTIKNGRITDAYISRCQTRYSCSWIEHLQIQVVDRQSPEVDFVSGATQSVNAFYYAVVEALLAAKGP